jgi:pimeloyl-ACP methyl ester carboxylesterase
VTSPTMVVVGDQDIIRPEHAVRMARAIPGARLLVVPANHGSYLGEVAASGGDTSLVGATVPFLTRFLDEDG